MNDDITCKPLSTLLTPMTTSTQEYAITAAKAVQHTITIYGPDNSPMVTIGMDGRLEYGPNYDPDAAAKVFWNALARHAPCGTCIHYHNSTKGEQK